MVSVYTNHLRLEEIGTGEQSGDWGTTTNTNLELIAEGFSYGTEAIADANITLTMADGTSDGLRSFYVKITSSENLTATRTITLADNTISKVWLIENATDGSQIITIKQGTGGGASVNIANGQVKMIATDGGGTGGIVYDLLTDVELAGTTTATALTVDDVAIDGKVITMTGSSGDTATMTVGTNGTLAITTTDTAAAAANITITADGTFEAVGTTITLDSGGDIELEAAAGGDVNIPANIGLTFGDDGEKIEGDGTDLTISGNNINLTAVADVNIPSGVGLTFATAEKIESDGTDLSITVGSGGDINIPADIGVTFGNDGEKIEGDGTDLTISGNNINLTATADVVIPANVGVTFGTGEKIEGDSTDLTITSGAKINLTATSDVIIPSGVGLVLDGSGNEKIESDGTDISISVGSGGDINIPANIGVTFGDDGEKIEGDGTDLTISGNNINLSPTSTVTVSGVVDVTDTTDATDATGDTGALRTEGGASIAKKLFVGTDLVVGGDLTISGDDLIMGTNTAGMLLIADGTNFNPTLVTSLSEISTAANDDVFIAIDTSAGDAVLKKITRSAIIAGTGSSSDLANVVEDTSPQLGGNLDVVTHSIITDASNRDINFQTHGTGVVVIKGNTDNSGTNAGAIKLNCSANSHGQTLKAQPHASGITNTMLLPIGSSSTLVSLISADTLQNKTFLDLATIKDTTDDANGAILHFVKDRGAAAADGDDVGTILFTGDNSAQEQTNFASIVAEVSESADTDEAGKLSFFVAESNGTSSQLTAGLILEGEHNQDGQVDVTIGAGSGSTTIIAGDLQVSGTTTTVNSTTVNLNDHNIVLDSGNSTSAVVNGAGITIEGGSGSDATFTYNTTGPKFELKLGSSHEDLQVDGLIAGSLDISGAADIAGDLTLSAGADGALTFSVASSVKIKDNEGASLVFEEADNAYMTFVTTNSSEAIKFDKALDINAAMDVDAAIQLDGTFTVGVDDTGYDVKFFGATSGQFLLWDESADELALTGDTKLSFHDAAGGENIVASSDGHLEVNAGTTLDVTAPTVQLNAGTAVDINGNTDVSGTLTVGGVLKTDDTTEATSTTDGSLQTDGGLSVAKDCVFGDDVKLLSDAAVLNFGANSEITVTHVHDVGLNIKNTNTGDDKPIILTLQTGETDLAANEVIGAIRWQAPDEAQGTDAILVSAAVQAVAEGNHSSSSNATRLEFHTGASEAAAVKMMISSAGNVAIGNTDPEAFGSLIDNLVIGTTSGENGMTIVSGTSNGGRICFADNTSSPQRGMFEYSHANDSLKINTNGATRTTIDSSGNLTQTANITAFSDRRLKSDIQTVENALDKVEQLRGVTYTRNDIKENGQQLGVIAQEVEEVFPQVVLTADDERGTKSVDYGRLTGALIEAVKELSAKVKELEGKLDAVTK